MNLRNEFSILALLTVVFIAGCSKDDSARSTVKNESLKAGIIPSSTCRDFVTGGGWIKGQSSGNAAFGVSGGIKNGKFWGQLSYCDRNSRNVFTVRSTKVTAYVVIDAVTRRIEGIAKINGKGSFIYKVVVVDNGKHGRNDKFSIELSNGYSVSGTLKRGNIELITKCGPCDRKGGEDFDDKYESDGNDNCRSNRGWN